MRIDGVAIGMPRMRLKSVKPLLPPKPVSLRKNSSITAKVIACVMIEKYTPLMRERKAKKPNTNASSPGTSTTSSICATNEVSVNAQCQGNSFQSRNTMKSGRSHLVLAVAADLAHQVHAHGVAAEREEHAVAERQDAGVAPDQVHRQRARWRST